jgi:hypothetical protein
MKPVRGIGSVGAFLITEANDRTINLQDGTSFEYHKFFDNFIAEDAFLLQTVIEGHAFVKKYTPNIATIRMQNTVTDNGVVTPAAVFKVPSKNNIADNVWREGNLVCNLDVKTGEILSAVSGLDLQVQHFTHHPETGEPLVGEVLPFWPEVCEINERAAKLFNPVSYQSQDIALTEDGPLVVEVNVGGAMGILQLASGKGFMTDANKELFRSCGCTLF